ncbi:MAG TPA: 1-(5-phosphoribosyl)-5-[(5-phosphoribosylamino)methylideneamino] imidazole-4-carboxamide isomerase [Gammaproteobacteria bacterium]|nr:1-(5-phosphoribosyl)-5-[(5-phosphoribosylamino)methylideneamino] imidazole-4-carboxamide isomerase [Gammaproteobacteria bacterium]
MTPIELIPAIDIRNGLCVRLLQGDFERETRYDVDPIERVGWYQALGAQRVHIVDLDGAREGSPRNHALIAQMAANGVAVQLGGGIRERTSLARALDIADRVVIGSLAVTDPATVMSWLEEFGAERIVLGFDVRIDGAGTAFVTTHGWTQISDLSLEAAIDGYLGAGLRHVLCTDVERDGAMGGPNLALYAWAAQRWPAIRFQASGGVRDAADLTALGTTGAAAAISGKALLDGRIGEQEMRRFLRNA